MENAKISDREAMKQVHALLERMEDGSPFAVALRRVFTESPVEAEPDSDVAPSAVDAALRAVRLPETTVRQWENESSAEA